MKYIMKFIMKYIMKFIMVIIMVILNKVSKGISRINGTLFIEKGLTFPPCSQERFRSAPLSRLSAYHNNIIIISSKYFRILNKVSQGIHTIHRQLSIEALT